MKSLAQAVIETAAIGTRSSRNHFFKEVDIWTARLCRRGLIDIRTRQEMRKQIAGAYTAIQP
ncbi:hypothetical protein D5S10_11430 [Pseudomonas savastanoi]|nr:hypothetical protein A3SK_0105800 [Pseudomonas amygdali pv. tabaci str. 6605]QOI04428.1 hypothetical protein D5S10_11430 [Pseudomonas savastanoi]